MPVIASILTALISGIVSATVTFRLNANKELVLFMRQKAEELFMAADQYGAKLGVYFLGFMLLLEGKLDYNQTLDLIIKRGSSSNDDGSDARKMEMITKIYFHELQVHMERFLECRDKANMLLAAHKKAYQEGRGDDERWIETFKATLKHLADAQQRFQDAVAQKAREYATDELVVMPKQWRTHLVSGSTSIMRLVGMTRIRERWAKIKRKVKS